MIIDCHGHYTTAPKALQAYRDAQIAAFGKSADTPNQSRTQTKGVVAITDDEIRQSLENAQLKLQRERGTDVTIFSPRASAMGHHIGDETTSLYWSQQCNDLIARVCALYPKNFVGVCQLPQSPGAPLDASIRELERCVSRLGFIGCNLNPDPSGGRWTAPPLTDRYWYPLYEKMIDLDVPAMVHVSSSCNPNFHATGAHYINADTTAFMQFLTADLFKDFPTLRFIIPHGGGAVPYHWGRYRGLAQDMKRPPLDDLIRHNVFFDTCVYHLPGIELLTKVVPIDNILFGSEMVGAVRGIDPETGQYFDDTKRYIDALTSLRAEDRRKMFEGNARRVYPRIAKAIPIEKAIA
jgi:4-oxalmesaconate hydratase